MGYGNKSCNYHEQFPVYETVLPVNDERGTFTRSGDSARNGDGENVRPSLVNGPVCWLFCRCRIAA